MVRNVHPRQYPGSWLSRLYGDAGEDSDALCWTACDLERSDLARGSFAHRLEAEVTREVVVGVEAGAVVGDLECNPPVVSSQLYLHVGCAGVLEGVVQSFLGDAVEGLLCIHGRIWFFAERGLDLYAVSRLDGGGLLFERGHESLLLERLRA
jgi:hypothetical protein